MLGVDSQLDVTHSETGASYCPTAPHRPLPPTTPAPPTTALPCSLLPLHPHVNDLAKRWRQRGCSLLLPLLLLLLLLFLLLLLLLLLLLMFMLLVLPPLLVRLRAWLPRLGRERELHFVAVRKGFLTRHCGA